MCSDSCKACTSQPQPDTHSVHHSSHVSPALLLQRCTAAGYPQIPCTGTIPCCQQRPLGSHSMAMLSLQDTGQHLTGLWSLLASSPQLLFIMGFSVFWYFPCHTRTSRDMRKNKVTQNIHESLLNRHLSCMPLNHPLLITTIIIPFSCKSSTR